MLVPEFWWVRTLSQAFLDPEKAANLLRMQKRRVLMLSHAWRHPGLPDPDGEELDGLLNWLQLWATKTENWVTEAGDGEDQGYGLFYDWVCLPQVRHAKRAQAECALRRAPGHKP